MTDRTINNDVTMRDEGACGNNGRLRPGDEILGRYVVEGELGQGGMGVVYRCLDRVGGVAVAVKGLPPEVSHNAEEMEDVRANFRLVSDLRHENICGVRTLECDDRGDFYLVMDLASGESLSRWMKKNAAAPFETKLALLRQIAAALDYAHARKIIHRDVKPENVMVADDGHVSVLDFGLAAQIRSSLSRTSTAVTSKSGTPTYKSPEQWQGQLQSAAADQYALGVIAFRLLAGRLPFDGDDLAVLGQAVLTTPVPSVPGVSRQVNAALAKALAKKPEARFATCTQFVDALAGKFPVKGSASIGRWVALAVCTVLLAGGGLWWQHARRTQMAEWQAREQAAQQAAAEKQRQTEAATKKAAADAASQMAQEDAARKARETEQKHQAQLDKAKAELDQANADKKKLEGLLAAAQKKSAPRPVAQEPGGPDDASVRAAMAELERLKRLVMLKRRYADELADQFRPFRDSPEGFKAKLDEVDSLRAELNKLQEPEDAVAGTNVLATAQKIVDRMDLALEWLKANKAARVAAVAAAAKIKDEIEPRLEKLDAAKYAPTPYKLGLEMRDAAKLKLDAGAFTAASALYAQACEKFAEAEKIARQYLVDTGLTAARDYLDARQWEDAKAAAEKVLALDEANDKAKKLQTEAEAHLKPYLTLNVTVDGREVTGAKVSLDGKVYTLPQRLELTKDSQHETFEVTYETGGRRYAERFQGFKVDWLGEKAWKCVLKEQREPQKGQTRMITLPGGAKLTLVWCPAGSFTMGSPSSEDGHDDDETQHRVTLTKGFWMGQTEVTQKQWESVMGSNPSRFKGDNRPVENVSWEDCQAFCTKAGQGLRLPTEAEWEYACRAGSTTAYCWGDALNGDRANCDGNYPCGTTAKGPYKEETADVGSYPSGKNAWGLYDMHGNVYEWCADWYGSYAAGEVTDPTGPASGSNRVLRGGSWDSDARGCRSASRLNNGPSSRFSSNGFRLCCCSAGSSDK